MASKERPEREPGSSDGLYEVFAIRLKVEVPERQAKHINILRNALALKIEDSASTPGYEDASSESAYRSVEKLRRGEKISCRAHRGFVSAIGQEFSLSEEDKVIFRETICEEGNFIAQDRPYG